MLTFLQNIFDWIYYKKCYFCKKLSPEGLMCEECFAKIKLFEPKQYKYVKNTEIFSATSYDKEVKQLIRGIKYHNKTEFADYAAKILYNFWIKTEYKNTKFIIIPMPLHKKRQKSRTYNHMELIAEKFSLLSGYPVDNKIIVRIKDTRPQYKLSKTERIKNLRGAFKADKNYYNGENLLLIDDICTTGITMHEMINTLNQEGITEICGLVISNP